MSCVAHNSAQSHLVLLSTQYKCLFYIYLLLVHLITFAHALDILRSPKLLFLILWTPDHPFLILWTMNLNFFLKSWTPELHVFILTHLRPNSVYSCSGFWQKRKDWWCVVKRPNAIITIFTLSETYYQIIWSSNEHITAL